MRTCALPPEQRAAARLGDDRACTFTVLAVEELFAGKIKAMADRRHPRDLYDLFRFVRSGAKHDSELLRKLAVLFCSTHDHRSCLCMNRGMNAEEQNEGCGVIVNRVKMPSDPRARI